MKRLGLLLAASSVAAMGCQRDDTAMQGELEDIKKDLGEIKEMLKSGAGAGARGGAAGAGAKQQRPQRPRPNPGDVYSVPVAGAPYKGAKDAKVTVVKAFEFA